MLKKYVLLGLAMVFCLGLSINTVKAEIPIPHNATVIFSQFAHNWITDSETLTIDRDGKLTLIVHNENERCDVQYALVNAQTRKKIIHGTVKPGQTITHKDLPAKQGEEYYLQGESRDKNDYREYALMNGKGFATLIAW